MRSAIVRTRLRAAVNLLVPVLLSWLGSELLGQLNFGNPYNYRGYRFTFDSPDPFVIIGPELWVYRPNSEITETIVYKRPFGGYFAEASCSYRIDDSGFVDNGLDKRDYDILLLGDSFTAGTAGCAWTDELRLRLPGLRIYNAGLPGTGLPNWAAARAYLHERGFRFAQIIVLFIADDFYRPASVWGAEDLACLHDLARCTPRSYVYPLIPGIDLAAISASRNQNRAIMELEYFWMRHLWVSYFLVDSLVNAIFSTRSTKIIDGAKTALGDVFTSGKPVRLIKISSKTESALRSDDARSLAVANYLGSRGLGFDRCDLSYRDFFSYDAHPTGVGYVHLAECVARLVRNWKPGNTATVDRIGPT